MLLVLGPEVELGNPSMVVVLMEMVSIAFPPFIEHFYFDRLTCKNVQFFTSETSVFEL